MLLLFTILPTAGLVTTENYMEILQNEGQKTKVLITSAHLDQINQRKGAVSF